MANALATVQATFLNLDGQYNLLLAACRSQADRDSLSARYAAAEDAYQKCIGQLLESDDAAISALCAQLTTINKQVSALTTEMGDMSKVLTVLDQALKLGQQVMGCLA
ncbi:MAG TPA: hypothetical protein VHX13_04045 [Acidobacteriaceae bacterium]|jgi:hypothetical protein|nr:hypothetical protein [Acidobacteriaceae bacterium]